MEMSPIPAERVIQLDRRVKVSPIYSKTIKQVKVATVMEQPCESDFELKEPEAVAKFWRDTVEKAPWFDTHKEHVVVVLLNTRYSVTGFNLVSVGSLNESIAHPRDVLRPAVVAAAYAILVMHNHPSGDPSPSQSDHSLTRRLQEASELLQIKLLDHVIVGEARNGSQGHFSFREAGVL